MKKKSKRMIIAGICLVLVAGVIIVLALTKEKWPASDNVSESETNSQKGELIDLYEGLDEEGFYEHMSTLTIEEIFDEVNQLSDYGLEYSDFMYFAFVLVERAEEISEDMILDTISNKENHENLRILAADILDYESVDDYGNVNLSDESVQKIQTFVLDEDESPSVRSTLIYVLPRTDATANILETVAYGEDEFVSAIALKALGYFAPERASSISEELSRPDENGED